jgi:predicted ATP-dependent serine protease
MARLARLRVATETRPVFLTELQALVIGNVISRERRVAAMFDNPPDWDAMIVALLDAWPSLKE